MKFHYLMEVMLFESKLPDKEVMKNAIGALAHLAYVPLDLRKWKNEDWQRLSKVFPAIPGDMLESAVKAIAWKRSARRRGRENYVRLDTLLLKDHKDLASDRNFLKAFLDTVRYFQLKQLNSKVIPEKTQMFYDGIIRNYLSIGDNLDKISRLFGRKIDLTSLYPHIDWEVIPFNQQMDLIKQAVMKTSRGEIKGTTPDKIVHALRGTRVKTKIGDVYIDRSTISKPKIQEYIIDNKPELLKYIRNIDDTLMDPDKIAKLEKMGIKIRPDSRVRE